jgi:hypothetical protein
MTFVKSAAMTAAIAALAVSLGACKTMTSGNEPATGAQAEISNANNQNANQSAQPGRAGTAPNGGTSGPGTSGTVSATPGTQGTPQ